MKRFQSVDSKVHGVSAEVMVNFAGDVEVLDGRTVRETVVVIAGRIWVRNKDVVAKLWLPTASG